MTGFKSSTVPLDEYPGGRIMKIIKHYGLNRNSFSLRIGMTNNSLATRIKLWITLFVKIDYS